MSDANSTDARVARVKVTTITDDDEPRIVRVKVTEAEQPVRIVRVRLESRTTEYQVLPD